MRVSGILLLCIALITTLFLSSVSRAAPGVNQSIGFQGRLLDSNGDIVRDGYYNIQFKIYQGGSGAAAGNPDGTLKWTETYINNGNAAGAVEVKNGYLSVNLGSVNAFGSSIDWNQDTLWLSMNVAGASTSCTAFGTAPCVADGEMLPMKRLTATPYAINSAQLGGVDASGYLRNTNTAQTADINITGIAQANTLQGNTSVLAPMLDVANSGDTLNLGTVNASTINIGQANSATASINIGTGDGNRTLTIGSTYDLSTTTIQGGKGGVKINTADSGGFVIHNVSNNYNPMVVQNGSASFTLGSGGNFRVINGVTSTALLDITDTSILTSHDSVLSVRGAAGFAKGITIQGDSGTLRYLTPGGAQLSTAINIPNYDLGSYASIMAFGVTKNSAATARGMLIADGREAPHQATIGVLSPDEGNIFGLSWNGSNQVASMSSTANYVSLQGNNLNLLTAFNNGGQANVGIGNSAAAGYALDVTGDINTSSQYRINGVSTLSNASLNFSAANTATITSGSGQLLDIDGKAGVNIKSNGTTVATFGNTNIQIGSGTGAGTPTLLTVDKGAAAPGVTGDAYLGSMYYDTTIGKLQCYEADGWGACSSSPDNFVTLSPEYSNAVMHGPASGTMKSDFCSDTLNINNGTSSQPAVCGTNETSNYYSWTTTETTTMTRSIYVTYQLPSSFSGFIAGQTSLEAKTDSSNASVSYQVYRKNSSGLSTCGSPATEVSTGAQSTWQKSTAQEPVACNFVAGESVVFKINLDASNNANAYVGNLNFAFK